MSSIALIEENGESVGQTTKVAALYAQAEEKIKLVEHLSGELSIPSVNELRYAGYHLTQYLKGGESASGELSKAENHCKRAIFDAVEAGVLHQLELIKRFQDDFRKVRVKDVVPAYPELRAEIKEAKRLITAPRAQDEDRAAYYEKCSEHLERLRQGLESLEDYRDDLILELQRLNRKSFFNATMLLIGAIGAVGAVFGMLSFYGYGLGESGSPEEAALSPNHKITEIA